MEKKSRGTCIRDIRKAEGLTAEAFGERIGMAGTYITRIERDKVRTPSSDTISRIIQAICKFDVMKNHDFDLTPYDPSFTAQIIAVSHGSELNKNYRLNELSGKLMALGESIGSLDKEELSNIAWYAQRKADRNEYEKKISEIRQILDCTHLSDEPASFAILFNEALTFSLKNMDNKNIPVGSVRMFSVRLGHCLSKEMQDIAFSLPIDIFDIILFYLKSTNQSNKDAKE